jgi:ketosteroid isomerase-like protein
LRRSSGLVALALAAALPAAAHAADPAPVIAAERAFAADGLALGIKQSFLKHSAPEAILLAPDPVKAHALYGARPDAKTPPLAWWPLWAGLAASGDLGFTTGPATFDGKPSGYYFTVWKRQADGGWKWIYDGGTPSDGTNAPGPQTAPQALADATGKPGHPDGAWSGVKAAEATLAAAASEDLKAAYAAALAPDARVQGSPAPPATTPAAVATEIASRAQAIDFSPLGGEVSAAGDLAWTYGDARWAAVSGPARGHYVRIWRRDRQGWRLVFDQILDVPPPKS